MLTGNERPRPTRIEPFGVRWRSDPDDGGSCLKSRYRGYADRFRDNCQELRPARARGSGDHGGDPRAASSGTFSAYCKSKTGGQLASIAWGVRMGRVLSSWIHDVVVSCRGLRRHPVFVAVAMSSLALGIGANAVVFGVVNGVLLQPLALPDADRLVAIWLTPPNEPDQRFGTNTGVFFTVRDCPR